MADREIDRTARFRDVYDQMLEKVTAYVGRRVPLGEVDDAVADVFLVVWRRLDDLPPGPELLHWTYGVARRVASDRRRSLVRWRRPALRLGALRAAPGDFDDHDGDPAVDMALLQLAAKDRELLRLTYWEGLSVQEISALMGISINATSIRLHRARRRFAAELARIETLMKGEVS